jgi:hypothetical protein
MLLVVPLRLLPKLQIPRKRKLMIIGVLSLGVFNVSRAEVPTSQYTRIANDRLDDRFSPQFSIATTISHIRIR